jgi:hypothetical protein
MPRRTGCRSRYCTNPKLSFGWASVVQSSCPEPLYPAQLVSAICQLCAVLAAVAFLLPHYERISYLLWQPIYERYSMFLVFLMD